MSNRIVELVQPEDLTGDLKLICDTCGIDVVRSLLGNCAGVNIYIPSPKSMPDVLRRYVDERFGGRPPQGDLEFKLLAVELDISMSSVRSFVKRAYH